MPGSASPSRPSIPARSGASSRAPPLDGDPLPLICLPMTSGTGSEVTPYAVFTDREGKNKIGFVHPRIFPSLALIDPEPSYSMPPRVAIDTSLDVLVHAAEAFLSTLSFPLIDLDDRKESVLPTNAIFLPSGDHDGTLMVPCPP